MMKTAHDGGVLEVVRAGIDTYQEPVVYMHADCPVCRSEGFEAQARIKVSVEDRWIIATLNVVSGDWLRPHQAALSESAWRKLQPEVGAHAAMSHPEPVDSMKRIRAKIYGDPLVHADYLAIMRDCVAGRLADIELAAFLTACATRPLDTQETVALTGAMIDVGARLDWGAGMVLDKHCVGGLPGNRTTPIVVAIVAACGYRIPKTSSRAITSPAGTADTMETLAPVELNLTQMRKVVEQEGGCLVWGGSVALSPADDVLIRVERPLDFDSDAQLAASVLSKKIAAGATHVLLDLPVGPTAKIRSEAIARKLGKRLQAVAGTFDLKAAIHISDGIQPIGRGIGPALEARDVLAVLARSPHAPMDLRERALDIAGALLDLAGARKGGRSLAQATLDSGRAQTKFEAICRAQGGQRTPPKAPYRTPVLSKDDGRITAIDNRALARLAKLAGAPRAPVAGVDLHVRLGDSVGRGQPLLTLHSQTPGELDYALDYHARHPGLISVDRA
jgi:thymidine phosphorylase